MTYLKYSHLRYECHIPGNLNLYSELKVMCNISVTVTQKSD